LLRWRRGENAISALRQCLLRHQHGLAPLRRCLAEAGAEVAHRVARERKSARQPVDSCHDKKSYRPIRRDTRFNFVLHTNRPLLGRWIGPSVTPFDNAFIASRTTTERLSLRVTTMLLSLRATTIERLSSVASCDNAVVISLDNDPATPTHPDVLAQPLPGHTTPTPSGEASVTSRDKAIIASCDNSATVIPHDNASVGGGLALFGQSRTR
jgi:hypothetical protein